MKKSVIIWLLCIVVLLVVLSYVIPFCWLSYTSRWKYNVENFDEYKADFETVADFCRNYFENEQSGQDDESLWLYYGTDNQKNFLAYDGTRLEVSDGVQDAVDRIDESFTDKDSNLAVIRYFPQGISFQTENGLYSLVYSFRDQKPAFIMPANDTYELLIKKIEDHWYHTVVELK